METMHLTSSMATDLSTLADEAVETYFADLGIPVSVVAHCDDGACPTCFTPLQQARAA